MNSRLICHVMTQLLPWNSARWLPELFCLFLFQQGPASCLSVTAGCRNGWPMADEFLWVQLTRGAEYLGLFGLLGRALHSQGAGWWQGHLCQARAVSERSWKPSAVLYAPWPAPELYGTRKINQLCLCVQASLLLDLLAHRKKVVFTSPGQLKERLAPQTLDAPQAVLHALPFHQGGKFCLPSHRVCSKIFPTSGILKCSPDVVGPRRKGQIQNKMQSLVSPCQLLSIAALFSAFRKCPNIHVPPPFDSSCFP